MELHNSSDSSNKSSDRCVLKLGDLIKRPSKITKLREIMTGIYTINIFNKDQLNFAKKCFTDTLINENVKYSINDR